MKFVVHRTNARIMDTAIEKEYCILCGGLVLLDDFRKAKEKTPNT